MKRSALVIALATTGCGASVPTLLAQQRYADAICAARHDPRAAHEVMTAVVPLIHPRARMNEITRGDVDVEDAVAGDLFDRFTFAKLDTRYDALRGVGTDMYAAGQQQIGMFAIQNVALLTNETTPDVAFDEHEEREPGPNVALTILSAGLLYWVPNAARTVRTERAPTAEELARAAPRAHALLEAFARAGTNQLVALPRPVPSLVVHVAISSLDDRMCSIHDDYRVAASHDWALVKASERRPPE